MSLNTGEMMPGDDSSFPISQPLGGPGQVVPPETDEPDVLYHYTDAGGLVGILSPSSWPVSSENEKDVYRSAAKMWASDVRYMNDQHELRFGAQRFCEVLRATASDGDALSETFQQLAQAFEGSPVNWGYRCFSVSLSEKPDSLSQWRAYSGGTGGFALGFTWDSLAGHTFAFHPKSTAMGNTPFPAQLRKVAYGHDAAGERAQQFVAQTRAAWHRTGPDALTRDIYGGPDLGLLAAQMFSEIATLKDAAFEEEAEWRLWTISERRYPVNVRATAFGLVPYLDVVVNLRQPGKCEHPTLGRVTVGPHPDKDGQVLAAQEMLRAHGFDPAVVRPSTVPFRSTR